MADVDIDDPDKPEYWLAKRRKALRSSCSAARRFNQEEIPLGALGLAISGGGLRSATLALGLAQALSRRDRLFDFDYLSTVSGGGYFGTFLSGLFVPRSRRGPASRNRDGANGPGATRHKLSPSQTRSFVEHVLDLDANQEVMWDPADQSKRIRNPIWWLREHSRYLAPNGPTDYAYAIAVLSRNWIAMIYTFVIAMVAGFLGLTFMTWLLVYRCIGDHARSVILDMLSWKLDSEASWKVFFQADAHSHLAIQKMGGSGTLLSPLVLLPVVALICGAGSSVAHWLTASMESESRWSEAARLPPKTRLAMVVAATAFGAGLLWYFSYLRHRHPLAMPWLEPNWRWALLGAAMELVMLGVVICTVVAVRSRAAEGDTFTLELRRRITQANAVALTAILATTGLAFIDTLALNISSILDAHPAGGGFSYLAVALAPGLAWLFGKLPQWFADGRLMRFLGKHVWTAATVAGVLAFALLALIADVLVHAVFWNHRPWSTAEAGAALRPATIHFALVTASLFVLTGASTGFINLSSLHNLYGGRLTRAYVGASNLARLRDAIGRFGRAKITDNHPDDFIDVANYRAPDSIAPIHLINVTLNETQSRDGSQLLDRDRKGVPLTFAPEGVLVDPKSSATRPFLLSWEALRQFEVDALSVGQLCAISGAAASSGMGARTTLGGALTLTFANVRLGYWWGVGDAIRSLMNIQTEPALRSRRPLQTFYYLYNEMTAQYSLSNPMVYLSDGGHFENSGAYELLRRRAKAILVGDFGQDPLYRFEDLENLVRKARIDLGLAISITTTKMVHKIYGEESDAIFLNCHGDGWREHAGKPQKGFALLLDVYVRPADRAALASDQMATKQLEFTTGEEERWQLVGRMIWLKSTLVEGLPEDVRGYAARNPDFPQQTTGDQFFDESQWESYRAIGFSLGELLLTETSRGRDAVRFAIPPDQAKSPVVRRRGGTLSGQFSSALAILRGWLRHSG